MHYRSGNEHQTNATEKTIYMAHTYTVHMYEHNYHIGLAVQSFINLLRNSGATIKVRTVSHVLEFCPLTVLCSTSGIPWSDCELE